MPVIGFIDLLASKSSALLSEQDFHRAMEDFHRAVLANSEELGSDKKIRLFADCFYFESQSAEGSIRFIQSVRNNLFSRGYFFKGAIGAGALDERDSLTAFSESVPKHDTDLSIDSSLSGVAFGSDVVSVYLHSEDFKGIGCFVTKDFCEKLADEVGTETYKRLITQSVFFPDDRSDRLSSYKEVALSEVERTYEDVFFSTVMTYFEEAKLIRKKYARFYLPLMMMMINSASMSTSDIISEGDGQDSDSDKRKIDRSKFLYSYFLIGGKYSVKFNDISGFPIPYLRMIDRLLDIGASEEDLEVFIRNIPSRKKVLSDLGDAPSFILSRKHRSMLGKIVARST